MKGVTTQRQHKLAMNSVSNQQQTIVFHDAAPRSNSSPIGRRELRYGSAKSRPDGWNAGGLALTAKMPDGWIAANDGEHLDSMIVTLDQLLSDRGQRDAIPHLFGDIRVDQYLGVVSQTAQP